MSNDNVIFMGFFANQIEIKLKLHLGKGLKRLQYLVVCSANGIILFPLETSEMSSWMGSQKIHFRDIFEYV